MRKFTTRIPGAFARSLPTALTLLVLAGVAYVGHRTDWKIPAASAVFGGPPETREDWCMDHGVPESTCIICRGLKANGVPPTEQVKAPSKGALGDEAGAEAGKPSPSEPTNGGGTKPRTAVQLASPDAARRAGITATPAVAQPIVETIEANAELAYDMTRYAEVAARVPGVATLVLVQAGQQVKRGDLLALVDSAEVGKAKAEFLQAAAQLASRKTALERIRSSTESGFRNQVDLVAAEAERTEASIRLFNARQALINLGLPAPALEEGRVPAERDVQMLGIPEWILDQLKSTPLTANLIPVVAPLDGVVIRPRVVPGAVVESAQTLFTVADPSRLWVHADLPLSEVGCVKLGDELTFVSDVAGAAPVSGRIVWISPEANEKTRTVQVRAEVPNSDGRLFARTFGKARIVAANAASAVVVPESAVQRDGQASLVFVKLNDEVYQPREVVLGIRSGGLVQIIRGVAAGEPVAVAGSYALAAQLNRGKLGAGCTDD